MRGQEVIGIVVNSYPNICKETLKRFRATLFQIEKDGLEGKQWGNSDDLLASSKWSIPKKVQSSKRKFNALKPNTANNL